MSRNYHQAVEGTIIPLKESILICNLETTSEKVFHGIIIPDEDASTRGIKTRWAQIYAVGEDIDYLEKGDWVLINHGRWTRGVRLTNSEEDVVIRMVDTTDLLLVSNEPPEYFVSE